MPYIHALVSSCHAILMVLMGRGETHLATAHDTLVLVVAEGALVADAHERCGAHVGVADGTLAVALVAEAADRDARLLAAHYEIAVNGVSIQLLANVEQRADLRMMARHDARASSVVQVYVQGQIRAEKCLSRL